MLPPAFWPASRSVLLTWMLCSWVFGGAAYAENSEAQAVVQAYRRPSEADLQWLYDGLNEGQPAPVSKSSGIIQTGISLTNCAPCKPVGLPAPPIPPASPPAPNVVKNPPPLGLLPSAEHAVVQMSGERLPPPPDVPKEPPMLPTAAMEPAPPSLPPLQTIPERLPVPIPIPRFPSPRFAQNPPGAVPEEADRIPPPHKLKVPRFFVPDMIGSTAASTALPMALPTMLLSQPNIAEHFSAEVQNRLWADYRFCRHDTQHQAVKQFTLGVEAALFPTTSLELRAPFFDSETPLHETSAALGNLTVFLKQEIKRTAQWTLSGGVGVAIPTAEDADRIAGKLDNKRCDLVPFLGVQWHPDEERFGHFVVQADLPLTKNELTLGVVRFPIEGQKRIRSGIQLGRWFYRCGEEANPLRLGGFVELDFVAVTAGGSDSSLSAAVGVPIVFGLLTCTNSLVVPLSAEGNSFDIGCNFSLVRRF